MDKCHIPQEEEEVVAEEAEEVVEVVEVVEVQSILQH